MASLQEIMQVCRLCLVSDQVNVPIFDGTSDIRETFAKISSCLPVKVSKDDNLPKKICEGCSYKLDLLYDFRNTSVSSEKQLLQWLQQIGVSSGIPTTAVSSGPNTTTQTNSDILVKQESFEHNEGAAAATAGGMSAEAQSYIMQQQKLPYRQEFPGFGESSTSTSEPPPKRARRAAAMKAPIAPETDSDEDDLDNDMTITKAESDDDSDEPDQPSYVDATSTSVDDQPGPSGVGKPSVEATTPVVMEERDQKFEKFKVYRNKRKTVIAADTVQYYRVRKFFNVWICRACCQEYSTPEDVTKHLRKHRGIRGHERQLNGLTQGNVCGNFAWTIDAERNVFTCTVCSTEFQDKFLFHEHFKESHHELFLCHQCNEKFSTSVSYLRHMRNHSNCVRIIVNGGVYNEISVCHICLEEFRNQKSFENHVREHPVCVVCSEKFVSYNNLLVHQLRSHTAHVDEETVEQSNVLDQISDTDKLNGNGNVYGGASENLACILNDDYSETDHDDSQIEDSGQKETALKRFSCSICRERFTTKLLCMEHISTHLTCVVCSKAFKNLPTLRIHQENTHTVDFKYFGPYIFLCDICGMNFRKYNSFEGHRLGHAGIKPYVCQYCSRGFSNRRSLLVHLKKHTGDKPFCCEHCGERFDRHTSFSNHVKRHTGERPFTCQVCDKGFITKQARNSHQVICTNRVVEERTESESDSSD